MSETKDAKKLGVILCTIILVIILFIVIYLMTVVFDIKDYEGNLPTTGTTTPVNFGYQKLNDNEKLEINKNLNDSNFIQALNNAISENKNLMQVNLLESEVAKFRFVYTINKNNSPMNIDEINSLVQKNFNTTIKSNNLLEYQKDNVYQYEIIKEDITYCYKAKERKANSLLVDKIKKEADSCNNDVFNYDKSLILNQIKIDLEKNNESYVYYAYVIID